ncbi:hypothetical protein JOD29_003137 [Lysinibacillus composti]|uniref:Peptidase n=1 Tax=Lysinibacillus composti TaxID=720633 RepID=A0A3N9UAT2_9BACI|nr:SH3 domain-containing C40 family peptidase [Lysinibacillus composti]MBM7609861.1 hypothetical protein [Lysinibacillus composti]RQW73531.1 peptidase [Lysinibacillus composti]
MKAIVTRMIANLHKAPSELSELIDEALYGMTVNILEDVDANWVRVQTTYRYEGYCKKEYLLIDETRTDAWLNEATFVIKQNFADILIKPKIQSTKVTTLVKGSIVRFLERDDLEAEWAAIGLPTGEIGYARKHWIQERTVEKNRSEDELRENIVQTALSYLNTPYRWGGKSPVGIDCSGLCSMAYLLNGIIIYRDAKIMDGFPIKEIPLEEIKKGDLLYFPGHIAMYLGDEQYVHSSLGGNEVSINSLNENHLNYRKDLATTITAIGSFFAPERVHP